LRGKQKTQARELAHHAEEAGQQEQAEVVLGVIDEILQRPEHEWFEAQKKLVAEAPENTSPPAGEEESPASEEESPEEN
jgi:hypothetical protein